jgi:hypothetical protein
MKAYAMLKLQCRNRKDRINAENCNRERALTKSRDKKNIFKL